MELTCNYICILNFSLEKEEKNELGFQTSGKAASKTSMHCIGQLWDSCKKLRVLQQLF